MSFLIQDLVSAQALRSPDAPAVSTETGSTSFGDLERQSNQIARVLREHGCRRGDRVCVLAPSTPTAIAAMLGILKADAIYMSIDPADPAAHVAAAVHTCQPVCVLTVGSHAGIVDQLMRSGSLSTAAIVGSLEASPLAGEAFVARFGGRDLASASDRAVASRNRATNPAHILFPNVEPNPSRAVVVTHAGVTRTVTWSIGHFEVRPGDRHAVIPSLARERTVFDVIAGLAAGAVILPWESDRAPLPRQLAGFMRWARLTQWGATAETLQLMADADLVAPGDFSALRNVIVWGAAAPSRVLQYWMRRVGHARFTSIYGVPEATLASAAVAWSPDAVLGADAAPIGTPLPGHEVLVLNGRREPVDLGESGDLWIRGAAVSPGYWRDAKATAEVFDQASSANRHDRMCRTGDVGRQGRDGQIYVVRSRGKAGAADASAETPLEQP